MTTELLEPKEVEAKALTVPAQARAIVVKTHDDYSRADEILVVWDELDTLIHATFDSICQATDKAHKEAVARRKLHLEPIEEGRSILKPKMATFRAEQERIRQDEERRVQEEARKREEEERIAKAADIEREAQRVAAQGHKEEAAAIQEEAEEVMNTPAPVVPPRVASTTPKTATKFSTRWFAEITSLKTLCKEIAEGRQPVTILGNIDMAPLNRLAVALKTGMNVPGVQAKSKTV